MILNATITKDSCSDWWLIEIIALDAVTQGEDFYKAVDMGIDLIRCIANDDKLPVGVTIRSHVHAGINKGFVEFTVEPNKELLKRMQ
jgi:hypothetical protein